MSIFNRFLHPFSHTEPRPVLERVINEQIITQFNQYQHLIDLKDQRQLLEVRVDGGTYAAGFILLKNKDILLFWEVMSISMMPVAIVDGSRPPISVY